MAVRYLCPHVGIADSAGVVRRRIHGRPGRFGKSFQYSWSSEVHTLAPSVRKLPSPSHDRW
jgi:hypothetical protein